MPSHNHAILTAEIIALSEADNWSVARQEWHLQSIYFEEEPSTCLCSHFPIIEVCVLVNAKNGNTAEVGNVCVNKFLGIPSKIIFDGLKRVANDQDKALNIPAVDYIRKKGWINDWEYGFLNDTSRKRTLSPKQAAKRHQINQRILKNVKRSKKNI
ncbi:hypothetical protein [Croceicoccus sp. Ery5]|uniref:hypothetical protein n=1 Tax=Croceicoccus sp. Ery5 TaxID=1703340 RepID=UPI001E630D62|nr:hypothetical protein [Croceicoccus sp. Ery5]